MPSDEQIKKQVADMAQRRKDKLKAAEERKAAGKKVKPIGPERGFEEHKAGYGSDYRAILSETKKVLDDLKTYAAMNQTAGIPFLFPWANRLGGLQYEIEDRGVFW